MPTSNDNTNERLTKLPPAEEKMENSAKENIKDKTNDIDELWEENSKLKKALKILEASITGKSVTPKHNNTEVFDKVIESSITEILEEAEKRLDAKIIVFRKK